VCVDILTWDPGIRMLNDPCGSTTQMLGIRVFDPQQHVMEIAPTDTLTSIMGAVNG
jgi:hypothetical protein